MVQYLDNSAIKQFLSRGCQLQCQGVAAIVTTNLDHSDSVPANSFAKPRPASRFSPAVAALIVPYPPVAQSLWAFRGW